MTQIQPQKTTESGFTIIEVLIGISIFAIGNLTSQATMLAHQKMEEVKAMNFDDLDALASPVVENNLDGEGNAGGIYNRTTTIDTALGTHAREIKVQVQWNAAHGGDRTVEVNSLTYDRWNQ